MKKVIFILLFLPGFSCNDDVKPAIDIKVSYPDQTLFSQVSIQNRGDTLIFLPASPDSNFIHISGRKIGSFQNNSSSGTADYFNSILIPVFPQSGRNMYVWMEPPSDLDTLELYFQYFLDESGIERRFHSIMYLVKDSTYIFLQEKIE